MNTDDIKPYLISTGKDHPAHISRRRKQLPVSIDNLKIFDLKTLVHMSIRIEDYNGKVVTQCASHAITSITVPKTANSPSVV
ncbi:hypothetical protein TNCV_2429281 [Trichonephila clavipes]|nr:hypothetical protein TNCV_2429281 [Trichonephila clavipes]